MGDSPKSRQGSSVPAARETTDAPEREPADAAELEARLRRLEKIARAQLDSDEPWPARQQRFRHFCDSHLIGLISWDASGDILDANDAFLAITGFTRDDLATGKLDWERITPPEYLEIDRAAAEELARTGRCRPYEKEYIRDDGSRIPVLLNCELVDPERGLGISYILDLSERKRREERVLRQHVLEILGAVIGGTAHDFNNLLTTIVCNTSVALQRIPVGHTVRTNLEHIHEASQRAAALCAQMQAYATPSLSGDLHELDLGQLVHDVCDHARSILATDVEIDLQGIDRDLRVTAQPAQLESVLLALLCNASEAMPNGGTITVTTAIGAPAPSVKSIAPPAAEEADRYAIVTVKDSGVGMDRETAQRMFDPFFSTKFVGRGMGLAAVHGIVRTHGGLIEVDTAVGAGTTIRVLLPMADSVH